MAAKLRSLSVSKFKPCRECPMTGVRRLETVDKCDPKNSQA
jgi:hypothetical protein